MSPRQGDGDAVSGLPAPVFCDGSRTLYVGDCRELLPLLQETLAGAVDVVITDPPYGTTSLDWDQLVRGWPALIRPLLASSGSVWCFGSLRALTATTDDFADWRLAQELVWEKHNGSNAAADRFRRVHELIAHYYPAERAWRDVHRTVQTTADAVARRVHRRTRPTHWGALDNASYASVDGGPRLATSVLHVRSAHGRAVHPTEKPVGVLLPLIAYSSPPGGLVLDPFAGSAATLIAARQLRRRAIGIEADPDHARRAAQRLRQDILPLPAPSEPAA